MKKKSHLQRQFGSAECSLHREFPVCFYFNTAKSFSSLRVGALKDYKFDRYAEALDPSEFDTSTFGVVIGNTSTEPVSDK